MVKKRCNYSVKKLEINPSSVIPECFCRESMDIYSNPISGFPPKDCGNDGSKSKNSFSKTTIMLNSYKKIKK
jgi:hypothetical protein